MGSKMYYSISLIVVTFSLLAMMTGPLTVQAADSGSNSGDGGGGSPDSGSGSGSNSGSDKGSSDNSNNNNNNNPPNTDKDKGTPSNPDPDHDKDNDIPGKGGDTDHPNNPPSPPTGPPTGGPGKEVAPPGGPTPGNEGPPSGGTPTTPPGPASPGNPALPGIIGPPVNPVKPTIPDKGCAFHPESPKCKPDQKGNCPPGFSHNDKGNCFPSGKCPQGFGRHDNDESGKCFPNGPHCPPGLHFNNGRCTHNGSPPCPKGYHHNGRFCERDIVINIHRHYTGGSSGGSSNSGYHGTQPIIFYDKPTPNDNAQILQTASKTQKFGNPAMVGEVKNNGPDTIQFAKVTATYYDNTNRILGSDSTYTDPSDIPAGSSAPFTILNTDKELNQAHSVKLHLDFQ